MTTTSTYVVRRGRMEDMRTDDLALAYDRAELLNRTAGALPAVVVRRVDTELPPRGAAPLPRVPPALRRVG